MNFIEFPEVNMQIAENQDEYGNIPAIALGGPTGAVVACAQLDPEELETVKKTGKIWFKFLTFGQKFQPMAMVVNKAQFFETRELYKVLDRWWERDAENQPFIVSEKDVAELMELPYVEGKYTDKGLEVDSNYMTVFIIK